MVKKTILFSLLAATFTAQAEIIIEGETKLEGQAATGTFAPYYFSSRENGETGASPYAFFLKEKISHRMSDTNRFSFGFGAELVNGFISKIDYARYDVATGTMGKHGVGPGDVFIGQLYGEVKYRSLFLTAGMKNYDRSLFDSPLEVGDLTLSDNARPVPQVRLGFLKFTDVPLTQGWLQIRGEIAYGKFVDNGWLRKQYNEASSFLTTGVWMHHKNLYFRIAPQERFTFTIGLQHAAQFGGTLRSYRDGEVVYEQKASKSFFKILFPKQNEGKDYYDGNHLGSWDVEARYRFDKFSLAFKAQMPWEDGSGIGKLNGWDGIWGLSCELNRKGIIDAVNVQYIDMMNQSGPMHWAPDDYPGTSIPGNATGSDDYYNNYFYDGWANYGMGLGTPFLKSPVYNTDGYPRYLDNRVRGIHAGIGGHPAERWEYRLLFSHRTSWGTPFVPHEHRQHATSWMAQCCWSVPSVERLTVDAALGLDTGSLYGTSFGAKIGITYSGSLKLGSKK